MTPTSTAAAPPPPSQARRPAQTAGLALLAYLAFNLLLPLIPPPHHPTLGLVIGLVLLSTVAFMLLQLWLSQAVVNLRPRPLVCVGLSLLLAALWLLDFVYLRHPQRLPVPVFIFQIGLGLSITLGCTFLGILLSRIIREPNVLLPVALIAMPIDYLGAMTSIGFTNQIVHQHPSVVPAISIPVPAVGAAHHGGLHPIGFIGPGDALFMAFFFAVVLRLNMNVRGTFWWMYGLLTLTMLIVLSPFGFNIAALVPMGLAVLIANFRYFKLKREEVFATIYAALLILTLVTGFYLYYSHTHKPAPTVKFTKSKGAAP